MKELSLEEIKKVQLNILKQVAEFCCERGINYSLYGGTLLGAIRHKGYIPWDDDIDISMPRPDYNKFLNDFHLIKDKNLKVHARELNKEYIYPFCKVSDERTLLKEYSDINYVLGINIDIFPIDGLPANYKECRKLMLKSSISRNFLELKQTKITKNRIWYKNSILFFSKILLYGIPSKIFLNTIERQTRKYKFQNSSFVGNIVWGYGIKERCNKSVYSDYVLVDFENNKLKAMKGYDEYLTNVFGNYMQLPPIEKQVIHHNFKAYLK